MNDPLPLVSLSREIAASPDTVWDILTTPASFSEWLDGVVTFSPEVGSPFEADFPTYGMTVAGEIVSLDHAERRLAVTWGLAAGPGSDALPAGSTLVTFTVAPSGAGCSVSVEHTRLPSVEAAEQQRGGWTFHLSRMALRANRTDLTAGLARSLPLWFEAWNEHDDASRMDALRASCAEAVAFQDDWTTLQGLELLSTHIANCFRFVPGWRLEHTGETIVCRGRALVGWRSVGPDGSSMEGFNHVVADPDGTIREVAGFQRPA